MNILDYWGIEPEDRENLPEAFKDYMERYGDALGAFAQTCETSKPGDPDLDAKLRSARAEYVLRMDADQFADATEAA